jgi:hypothetical protein
MESKHSPLTLYRHGTRLYGGHPRFGDKVIFFVRGPTGALIPGGLCALPEKARRVDFQEISSRDVDTILRVLKSLGEE